MLKLLRTLARVAFGYVLASIAAGLVTVLFVNTPADVMSVPLSRLAETASETFDLALLTATHAALFAAAFVLIVAGLGEWFSIRAMSFYIVAGIAIAALGFGAQYSSEVTGQPTIFNTYAMTAFLTTGLFAGFVYWLASGQFAGLPPETGHSTDVSEPETSERTRTTVAQAIVEETPEIQHPRPRFVDTVRPTYDSLVGRLKSFKRKSVEPMPEDDRLPVADQAEVTSIVVRRPIRGEAGSKTQDNDEPGV